MGGSTYCMSYFIRINLCSCCSSSSHCFVPPAKLLRQGHHHRVPEEDRDLLEAGHRRQRRDHLRLQIPPGGEQDSLPVWNRELPRDAELAGRLLFLTRQDPGEVSPARFTLRPPFCPHNTQETETHTCTFHAHFSYTSRCVRGPCHLACDRCEGGSIVWVICSNRGSAQPGMKGLSISTPISV